MDISESTIRNLRKKAKSWLASLTYYSAQGKVNVDTFSRRLQSLFEPALKPDILKEAVKDTLPETIEPKEATGIKKRIMGRLDIRKIINCLGCTYGSNPTGFHSKGIFKRNPIVHRVA